MQIAEEIELQHKQFEKIAAENEKIYKMLLSSEAKDSFMKACSELKDL